MKVRIYLLLAFFTLQTIHSQDLDYKIYSFSKINTKGDIADVKALNQLSLSFTKITENTYFENERFLSGYSFLDISFVQILKEKTLLFNPLEINNKFPFNKNFDKYVNMYQTSNFILFDDQTIEYCPYTNKKLNEKLFSNFKIVENTYLDHERFLRGCGYLEDGVTNPVDSAGLMFSMVLNNLVNNVLLTKGIFAKKLN